jgi:hypothetical protein
MGKSTHSKRIQRLNTAKREKTVLPLLHSKVWERYHKTVERLKSDKTIDQDSTNTSSLAFVDVIGTGEHLPVIPNGKNWTQYVTKEILKRRRPGIGLGIPATPDSTLPTTPASLMVE